MIIRTVFDFNKVLGTVGKHTKVGCYPTYFITADGAALSFQAAIENQSLIRGSIIDYPFHEDHLPIHTDGWRVVAIAVNWEDKNLYCDHTGQMIETSY